MSTKHPNDKAPDWTDKTLLERFIDCRTMLLVHGFLSDAESEKVGNRIRKWALKHGPKKEPE